MKHTLLIKTVCLVLFTVILSAALTALVFRYAGIKKYGELKTKELIPRAEFISSRAADLMEGILSRKDFENIVNTIGAYGMLRRIFIRLTVHFSAALRTTSLRRTLT